MGADMTIATIAAPADRDAPPDFDSGRAQLAATTDVELFTFDDPEYDLDDLVADFDPSTHLDAEGAPTLAAAKLAGSTIIDRLESAFGSREITTVTIADYSLFVSGGLSWGDPPTEAAEAIWDAYRLPRPVLHAMGFIADYTRPLSRSNGNPGHVTDTDVVDAIALGLGTKPEWSGADELEWIADTIGAVRPHPGDRDPLEYRQEFAEQHDFDPIDDNFLNGYVSEEAVEEDED